MKLVEQHIIKQSSPYFKELVDLCVKSTNLYNYATFCLRQHFFNKRNKRYEEDIFSDIENEYLSYQDINRKFKSIDQFDYRQLATNISQEVLKNLDQNWKSFFALLRKKKANQHTNKVNIPGYKKKQSWSIIVLNVSTLSHISNSFKLPRSKTTITGLMHLDRATQIRIVPRNGYLVLEVIYSKDEAKLRQDNKRYLSIDLGQNNLCACTSNKIKSFIINGRPVKSINQYYNKKKGKLQSELEKINKTKSSKSLSNLGLKRKNKIDWYFHNASKYIIDTCINNNINTIIIGYNKEWKDEINLGKQTNQNFVSIPFTRLISQLQYKAKLVGLNIVLQEESYTSKASFLDNDFIPTIGDDNIKEFSGKRIKRGLYLSKDKVKINADINGSLNIMRKYLNVASNSIIREGSRGLVVSPDIVQFKWGVSKRK